MVNPIALSARLVDENHCCQCSCEVPENICSCYGNDLVTSDCVRKVLVSMGLFSIVRIERTVQILVDAIDFCIPETSCTAATPQNPCDLFNQVRFPIDEFFPPAKGADFANQNCGGGCGCKSCGCGC